MKEIRLPDYYLTHGEITDPGQYGSMLNPLPDSVEEIVDIIHGLILHIFWAKAYGVTLDESQKEQVYTRYISDILGQIREIDQAPLNKKRKPENRFVGNCRDIAVFLTSLLRAKGVPARARAGFGTYFTEDRYEDHWICQYWNREDEKWINVDPEIDPLKEEALKLDFDPLNLPPGKFITAAQAWKMCREGEADPDKFGIFDMKGLWFIRGNLIRDLASLNKMEMLPFDCWGLISKEEEDLTEADYQFLDEIAELILTNNPKLYEIYETKSELRVPETVTTYKNMKPIKVKLK